MIIYKIKHIESGKIYIGQTRRGNRRWYEHINSIGSHISLVDRAIKKYGKECFEYSIIENVSSIEELNRQETKWIIHYNSLHPNGYNLILQDDKRIISDLTRERMREAQRVKNIKFPITDDLRERLSKQRIGVKKSEAHKKSMSEAHNSKKYIYSKIKDDGLPTGVVHKVNKSRYTDAYTATFRRNGKYISKSFSVTKYGEKEALQMAINCRKGMELQAISKLNLEIRG